MVHSDQGTQYSSSDWRSFLKANNLVVSVSRRGNCQSTSIEQFIQALDSYIRWYNEKRIKISLGALSPVEYRESLGLAA